MNPQQTPSQLRSDIRFARTIAEDPNLPASDRPTVAHTCATVLIADVRDSTRLSRVVGLRAWWLLINDLYESICDGVHRFGGWIGNFTGDGVTAVFDACEPPQVHAQRACDAALWVRDLMHSGDCGLVGGGEPVALRIGLNSGDIAIGAVGPADSSHYTAIGYPVALAKRMESAAQPGRVYISEHTAALAAQDFELRNMGAFRVKGARAPVGVFELVGRRRVSITTYLETDADATAVRLSSVTEPGTGSTAVVEGPVGRGARCRSGRRASPAALPLSVESSRGAPGEGHAV